LPQFKPSGPTANPDQRVSDAMLNRAQADGIARPNGTPMNDSG